jgi:hypothetical protein
MRSCSNRVIELNLSGPKTIKIKQYLSTNNYSSNLNKQQNFILQKHFIYLKKICDEQLLFSYKDQDTDVEYLQKWRK